jgi:RNA-directed DNA polymerase
MSKSDMQRLIREKERFVVRRDAEIRGKQRKLIYPSGRFRRAHELLKFHCAKIRHGAYLFSPRKGYAQRDNALLHVGQRQFLMLDIKQFYPSTTREHVFRWAVHKAGMFEDVAAVFTEICTIDDRVSFGSPLTPVLATIVHRDMFDEIASECWKRGLRISVWVDDIVVSGNFIRGDLLDRIREIIASHGLKTHKLKYREGARAVSITGIDVRGGEVSAPNSLNLRVRDLYEELKLAGDDDYAAGIVGRLLSALGTQRYIAGRTSKAGQILSQKMEALRQRYYRQAQSPVAVVDDFQPGEDLPWA